MPDLANDFSGSIHVSAPSVAEQTLDGDADVETASSLELKEIKSSISAAHTLPYTLPTQGRPSTTPPSASAPPNYLYNSNPLPHRRSTSMNRKARPTEPFPSHEPVATHPYLSSYPRDSAADDVARSQMESLIEYRRRKPSIDSPTGATQLTNLMSRERFSLDDALPPTPRTPGGSHTAPASKGFLDLPRQDQRNFCLLVLLYFVQGVPMGLAMGSIPVLLKAHPGVSYSQIGTFSLASYPYSLKLLWSPIVDAIWSPALGRRKSWILPVQMVSGFGLLYLGANAAGMLARAAAGEGSGIVGFTIWWFMLVALCATQDIAVDGWALTLLSAQNLAYASTAQTVGLTAGQFLSYTVFLAFNSADFANHWFRGENSVSSEGLLSLGSYLTMAGWLYILVTIGLTVLKREERTRENDSLAEVYVIMWRILKLKHIQTFLLVHLFAKIGFQANESATNLKLLEKGFGQENISLTALIDFPIEIALGYWVGSWSATKPPIALWCWAFMARLVAALVAQCVVLVYPSSGVSMGYLMLVITSHVFSTVTGTIMFVAIAAFHAKVADPSIGGTYMTLLATLSNLGGTWPKVFVLKLIDTFTRATCRPPPGVPDDFKGELVNHSFSCAAEADKMRCKAGAGICTTEADGYHITNLICVAIGAVTFFVFIRPAVMRLQELPLRAWREASVRR